MKKLCFLLLFGAAACTQQPTDHFILRGTVPESWTARKLPYEQSPAGTKI